jgi:hypothetical protein
MFQEPQQSVSPLQNSRQQSNYEKTLGNSTMLASINQHIPLENYYQEEEGLESDNLFVYNSYS